VARPLRVQFPGAFYHITSRGNERKPVFITDTDRKKFLSYLQSAHEKYGALLHCFCFLPNHYHLLLETPRGNLSEILHHINGAYTTYFNIKRKRSGHLFQGRFKAILVEKEVYAQELSRYIHLNPVRAGLAEDPSSYPWSSYPYYVGLAKRPSWMETRTILGYFSRDEKEANKAYRDFVEQGTGKEIRNPLKEVVGSTFLCGESYIEQVVRRGGIPLSDDKRNVPALRVLDKRPSLKEIENWIQGVISRQEEIFRKFCLYFSHRFGGYSLEEIGAYYGMKGAAVSQAARRFQKRIRVDSALQRVENKLLRNQDMLKVET
jgi:putative transposase